LILGAGGNVSLYGEVGQELINVGAVEFAGVDPMSAGIFVEPEELFDPAEVGLFGADGHMFCSEKLASLFQQGGLARGRSHRILHIRFSQDSA